MSPARDREPPEPENAGEGTEAFADQETRTFDGEARDADSTGSSAQPRLVDFVVERRLGRGGMGEVWLAEQTEPVRRRVAVKLIRRGLDSRRVLERFAAERQALARMAHPNVASILDAGRDLDGRPFLAMEYVDGEPITDYCDRRRLGVEERLRLFQEVCAGVAHAHQKGILHRDLKPSNVLVAEIDGRPLPKVIDFGVAKAVAGDPLSERSEETQMGQILGTPAYMSPEQRAGRDIDTRTDVYSLGVILYELLVGATPAALSSSREAATTTATTVPPPSRALAAERRDEAAERRGLRPRALTRRLRGDLDWILTRALEPERERRYSSVTELRQEIDRHLRSLPLEAGRPDLGQRVVKWTRRHRGWAATLLATGVITLVAAALIVRFAVAERAARQEAEREARIATAVEDFLVDDLLGQVDGYFGLGREATLEETLARAAESIDERFVDEPAVRANVQNIIGKMYRNLGDQEAAYRHLREARETALAALGPDHPLTLEATINLGIAHSRDGELEAADELLAEAYEHALAVLGPTHEQTIDAVSSFSNLLRVQDRLDEAERVLRSVIEPYAASAEPDENKLRNLRNDLGLLLWRRGELDEAERIFRQLLDESVAAHGANSPTTLAFRSNVAVVLAEAGRLEDAAPIMEEVARLEEQSLGETHPAFLLSLLNSATYRLRLGDLDEAEARYRRAEALYRRTQEGSFRHGHALSGLGATLARAGRFEEAEGHLIEAWPILERELEPRHRMRAVAAERLLELYTAWGKAEEADRWQQRLEAERP